jgi:hypothetical protein
MKFIKTLKEFLNESIFPDDVLKTLEEEYGHYYLNNFDWNSKRDEYKDNTKGFTEFLKNNKEEEFNKNLNKIIIKVREDLILLIKRRNVLKVLKDFEELIIPCLDNSILVEPLSKFMEYSFLNLNSTEEIEKAYIEAKNIIDKDGSLNHSKITTSSIFKGEDISLPNFERFVIKNPEYQGVFNDWKKLFDEEIDLSIKELNAFRDSASYIKIRNLYDYLIEYRKNNNL